MYLSGTRIENTSPMNKRFPHTDRNIRQKRRSSRNSGFDRILEYEEQKIADKKKDEHIYYKCMECLEFHGKPKQLCKKCGECGREFNEEGVCENIQIYPTYW